MTKRYRVIYRSIYTLSKSNVVGDYGSTDHRFWITAKLAQLFWSLGISKGHVRYSRIELMVREF